VSLTPDDLDQVLVDLAQRRGRARGLPPDRRTRAPLRVHQMPVLAAPRSWSLGFRLGLAVGGWLPKKRSQTSTCGDDGDLTWE
jgi:hypothetical protein